MRYFHFRAGEQFPPDQLLRQATAAEAAGFDGIGRSGPATQVERIRAVAELGATTVALMNDSGADPIGAIEGDGRDTCPETEAPHHPGRVSPPVAASSDLPSPAAKAASCALAADGDPLAGSGTQLLTRDTKLGATVVAAR